MFRDGDVVEDDDAASAGSEVGRQVSKAARFADLDPPAPRSWQQTGALEPGRPFFVRHPSPIMLVGR